MIMRHTCLLSSIANLPLSLFTILTRPILIELIPRMQDTLSRSPNNPKLCAFLSHMSTLHIRTDLDGGFGCGFRCLQMLLSVLLNHPLYHDVLVPLLGKVPPDVLALQRHIEAAWKEGFDVAGARQLGYQLEGTRKWIG